ncbi:MAG: S46 family peptidase [Pirellulaceae bacterium]|nr:S46 family peptidase [Pirellulaceae bacterium]
MKRLFASRVASAVAVACALTTGLPISGLPTSGLRADEGMWLFNALPKKQLQEKHQFTPTQAWADHLMLSSVRVNSGGSSSFISSTGLVLTNHHVASDTLYKLSTPERNINSDGYYAKTRADELSAPDLELNQLVSIEDVTEKVNAVVKPGMAAAEANKERQKAMAEIEQAAKDKTGLRCDVVTLYGGARYHLYRYKAYTDVRLVWAPEAGTAFFGGDADNFEYPRYCLDVTIFRVYENGQPAKIDNFLAVNPQGAQEGDLVFVSGNPGTTRRILTADAMAYQRDYRLPKTLDLLRRKENLLQQYALGGPEQARRGQDDLFGIQNSRKAYMGMLGGLQDPGFMTSKRASEAALKAAATSRDAKLQGALESWKTISDVQTKRREMLGKDGTLRSQIYGIAETLVLMSSEDAKDSGERLREFRDSNRSSLEQSLFSPAPMYDDLERVQLADELGRIAEERGGDAPLVLQLLAGKSPRDRAAELIAGTKLMDVAVRKELAKGGKSAIAASQDPLIKLAMVMEPEYRRLRLQKEELDEIERQAYAKITEVKFATEGESNYPDATFTLRLAFGVVKGYEEDGQKIAARTSLSGAFEHEKQHAAKDPWILPESWKKAKDKMKGDTPFNFVSTADIIGGNSGSPVVDREGKLVGIIFDGNIQSLTGDFNYTEDQSRSVSVHIAAVLEALRSIYGAKALADEIGK